MEIKAGQIWQLADDESKKCVILTKDSHQVFYQKTDCEYQTKTQIRDFLRRYKLIDIDSDEYKGLFVREIYSNKVRETENKKPKEIIVKADGLKIGGVDMSDFWADARIKGMAGVVHPKENVLKKHHHYFKDVSDYKEIDVYALCKIFEIDDPSGCTQHAIKKLLVTGKRGDKDRLRDLQDVIDTVKRLIELETGNE